MPKWDYSFLGDKVNIFIRFINEEEMQYFSISVLQAASQFSKYIAVSKSLLQTPLLLVDQREPISALTTKNTSLN